jgi:rare lipoprotein A
MRRTSFRIDRRVPSSASIRKLGVGVLMMGLALVASAKDEPRDSKPVSEQAPAKTVPKATKTRHWLQIGVASWYGSHFQGHKTATGERFDMNTMTCAHRTLPLGTWLRVTNLKNRKTAFVRVNDRGPVVDGRIIDLSFAAAQSLGLSGVGRVKLEALRDGDTTLARALVAQLQIPVLFDPVSR